MAAADRPVKSEFWLLECKVVSDQNIIVRGTEEISINPRSMALLLYLVKRQGELISAEELVEQVWPANHIGSNTVYKAVNELRNAFGDDSKHSRYIETLSRHGYRLKIEPEWRPIQSLIQTGTFRRWGSISLASVVVVALLLIFALQDNNKVRVVIASIDEQKIALVQFTDDEGHSDKKNLVYSRTLMKIVEDVQGSLETVELSTDNFAVESLLDEFALDQVVLFDDVDDGLTIELNPAATGYAHLDYYPDNTDIPTIVDQILTDLNTLLDKEHKKRMQDWGTADIHAYRYAYDGNRLAMRADKNSLVQSVELFRKAVDTDPKFGTAYHSIAMSLTWISNIAKNTEQRERVRRDLQELVETARYAGIEDGMIHDLEDHLLSVSATHPLQLVTRYLEVLSTDPENTAALIDFSIMLSGAGLGDEATAYLDAAIDLQEDPEMAILAGSNYISIAAISNPEEQIRLAKISLSKRPNMVITLYGVVSKMALMGNYVEAELYLERLRQADVEGAWAHAAWMKLAALRGDLPLGSEALENAVADPLATNLANGQTYLTLGDVEKGLAALRNMEAGLLPLLWQFKASIEAFYPNSVLDDYRYKSLMNDLGVGQNWRYYLLQQTEQLASITGIPRTTLMEQPELQMIAAFDAHGVPVLLD
jgi:DNA-binding winged helix-turn-helix (wHTH) protein